MTTLHLKMNVNSDFRAQYSVGKLLGKGQFGRVHVAVDVVTGDVFAAKIISVSKVPPFMVSQMHNEALIMQTISHPNVVKFHKFFDGRKKKVLLMERGIGGTLLDYIHKVPTKEGTSDQQCRKPLAKHDVLLVLRALCSACAHVHEHKVVHRDLKPDNIIIRVPNDLSSVLIVDFGLAKMSKLRLHKPCGTLPYMAPEFFKEVCSYGSAVDMWSVGMIGLLMFCGSNRHPLRAFRGWRHDKLRKNVKMLKKILCFNAQDKCKAANVPEDVSSLLCGLLNVDQMERLTAVEALSSAVFRQLPGASTRESRSLSPATAAATDSPASRLTVGDRTCKSAPTTRREISTAATNRHNSSSVSEREDSRENAKKGSQTSPVEVRRAMISNLLSSSDRQLGQVFAGLSTNLGNRRKGQRRTVRRSKSAFRKTPNESRRQRAASHDSKVPPRSVSDAQSRIRSIMTDGPQQSRTVDQVADLKVRSRSTSFKLSNARDWNLLRSMRAGLRPTSAGPSTAIEPAATSPRKSPSGPLHRKCTSAKRRKGTAVLKADGSKYAYGDSIRNALSIRKSHVRPAITRRTTPSTATVLLRMKTQKQNTSANDGHKWINWSQRMAFRAATSGSHSAGSSNRTSTKK